MNALRLSTFLASVGHVLRLLLARPALACRNLRSARPFSAFGGHNLHCAGFSAVPVAPDPYRMNTWTERAVRWLRRVRHRCGYGVHSPYAFSLITDVVYNNGVYYAYDALSHLRSPRLRRKDLRLVFRLANFSRARRATVLAAPDAALRAYLTAGRGRAEWTFLADTASAGPVPRADFLYTDATVCGWAEWTAACMAAACDGSVVVVRGVGESPSSRETWRQLCAAQRGGISLDLHDFGIFCMESRLFRQDYIVNYF